MGDSYRPTYGYGGPPPPPQRGSSYYPPPPSYENSYRPPPPSGSSSYYQFQGNPPLPSGPPPPMPQFGRDIGSHNDFAFRSNDGPRYPQEPPRHSYYQEDRDQRRRERDRRDIRRPQRGRGAYRGRVKVATSERALLTYDRGSTPEQLAGMNDSDDKEKRFIDFDDVSDSSEASMDESEESGEDGEAPPVKKRKTVTEEEDNQVPKWSNPEVYTSLPPVEDATDRKKKDVVKLIRKARVAAEQDAQKHNTIADNVDFISFDLGDDDASEKEDSMDWINQGNNAPAGAPKGPANKFPLPAVAPTVPANEVPAGAPTGPRALSQSQLNPKALVYANGTSSQNGHSDGAPQDANTSAVPPTLISSGLPAQIDAAASIADRIVSDRKRKREEFDDSNLVLTAPINKRGRPGRPDGSVLPHWANVAPSQALPWVVGDHRMTENSGFRLHKEICDFYDFVKPRKYEHKVRIELLERLQHAIHEIRPDATVMCFGSFAAGLYLPNADMDVVLISDSFQKNGLPTFSTTSNQLNKLGIHLVKNKLALSGSVEVIAKAKVPLIKYVDSVTRIRVDMSFENMTGIVANNTFQVWKKAYPAVPVLCTIIKQFLLMRGLNEVPSGGIGGFSITCLVVSFMQHLPRLQAGHFRAEDHLGEMLLEILDYYGNRFDHRNVAIRMQPPGLLEKRYVHTARQPKIERLCILDPNDPNNDISGGTAEVDLILNRFSAAREEIMAAMRSGRRSLLDWVLGGNYNDFLWHRKKLRELFVAKYGSVDGVQEKPVQVVDSAQNAHLTPDTQPNRNIAPSHPQTEPLGEVTVTSQNALPVPVADTTSTTTLLAPSTEPMSTTTTKTALEQSKVDKWLGSGQESRARAPTIKLKLKVDETGPVGTPASTLPPQAHSMTKERKIAAEKARAAEFKREFPDIARWMNPPSRMSEDKRIQSIAMWHASEGGKLPHRGILEQWDHPQHEVPADAQGDKFSVARSLMVQEMFSNQPASRQIRKRLPLQAACEAIFDRIPRDNSGKLLMKPPYKDLGASNKIGEGTSGAGYDNDSGHSFKTDTQPVNPKSNSIKAKGRRQRRKAQLNAEKQKTPQVSRADGNDVGNPIEID